MLDQEIELSIVIVSYNRSKALLDTIAYLLKLDGYDELSKEIVIVDQTREHNNEALEALQSWGSQGVIRWIRLPEPNLTGAMNRGLREAKGDIVLYLDDDIVPDNKLLVSHLAAHQKKASVAAVIGQILQPGESPQSVNYRSKRTGLKAFMDFPFYSTKGCLIENAMAGNMSLKRKVALRLGGFDEQFIPPVAARFETEFAKRLILSGETIWFEPSASIRHLAVASGGVRSLGSHLNSAQAYFGFGDYYYALRHGEKIDCIAYCVIRFFREVRTKYHLARPWYIPVKWLGEIRAFSMALKASRQPQKLISLIDADRSVAPLQDR